ncbi:MAG TPA: sigma-70 family RNA polymerase sigma factor [Gaiellaceae bacterium]|nr:sigma-70 family RNA polymerase sigma factor [Gaiellaceae bacterium]
MAATATDSFERLYRRYSGDVYRFALSVVRNPAEAEDVTQTAFLNAFRAYRRGERPERPHSWLIAIAHNAIRSRARWTQRRPREVALEAAAAVPAAGPADQAEARQVLHALGELPANQRDALALRELEGRTYPEIAATLGVSVTAVESLIARARRSLRRQRELLRGLLLLPFRHADEAGTGVAAKAATVVAAAGLAVGGIAVGRDVAPSAPRARAPEAVVPLQRSARPLPVVAAAVGVRRTHVAHRRHSAPPEPPRQPSAPPPPAPVPAAAAAPAAPAPQRSQPPPSAHAAPPAPVPAAPAAAAPPPPVTSAVPVPVPLPSSVSTPPVAVETPAATVEVPAVAVPVPALPPVPQLPPPPSVPQVPELPGIK